MRAVDIRIHQAAGRISRLKDSFRKNWRYYLCEALGLAIFMISACFFSAILFGNGGYFLNSFSPTIKQILLGLMMGSTALYIFYSPLTSPSGSHINPAVTMAFFRLGKIDRSDAFFYMLFQTAGGTIAVYIMAALMGKMLTDAPLFDVVTKPGKSGVAAAATTELIIAFIMMSMVLFTADHSILKKYSRIIAAILVCLFVIFAGPISGFGMNPARSFASAVPANLWTSFWIYLLIPFAGMLTATEFYRWKRR